MSDELNRQVWDALGDLYEPEDEDDLDDLDDLEGLDNIVTLTDENGNDVQFEFLDLLEFEGEEYLILLPVDDESDDGGSEVVILRVSEVGEDNPDGIESYESVDDPQTLAAVYEVFKEKFKDEFYFAE